MLFSSVGLQILNPQLLGFFIDTVTTSGNIQKLFLATFLFSGIAILVQILTVVTSYLGETVAWIATNALRLDLVQHCLCLDLSFHQFHPPGELLERVDGDVTILARFFSQLVIHVLGNALLLIGILFVLFLEDWRAGLSLSLFSLIAVSILLNLRSFAVLPWTHYRQMAAEFFGFLTEYLGGREDIRANGAISYVMHQFHQMLQRWLPIYQQARFASTVLWAISVGLFTFGNVIALAIAAYLWQQNAITIGTAYLIFHYTNLLQQPIERIREELEELQQVAASIQRIQELLATPAYTTATGQRIVPDGAISVRFDRVRFSYPTHEHPQTENPLPILQDLTFHLPAGQILGLLGHTGSGKSTIARLLLQFYDCQSGEIQVGDISIAQADRQQLRQRIGFVTQNIQLFQASVRDNLTFFNSSIQDSQILVILEEMGLQDWLRSLPHGLDTQLGADSSGLSAGQAQLLAFARVFLENPGLVILDEASSRLDPTTETQIERATERLLSGRTGIIIAHRIKTVQRADQILILEQGKVLEYGDRLALLRNPQSHFTRLSQFNTAIE
jgi:ATP-binding cassette subfamily B protein/ATP-binding cassette subfamily C protein